MLYIVESRKGNYVTVEPRVEVRENEYPIGFAWTEAKAEAVRFSTRWHAEAIVRALPCGGRIIEVKL